LHRGIATRHARACVVVTGAAGNRGKREDNKITTSEAERAWRRIPIGDDT
jgi:hypothetical protein